MAKNRNLGKVNPDPPEPVHKFRYPFLSPTHDMPKKKQLGESQIVSEGLKAPRKSDRR